MLVAPSGPPSIDDGLGAPPAFGGEGHAMGSTSGATLYGIVPDDSLEAPISLGVEDSGPLPSTRLRSSPSASGASSDRIGIPRDDEDLISSGLFDSNSADDNFGDLDLPMPGDDLDIDLPDVARGRAPQPLFTPPKPGAAAPRAQVGTSPRSSAPIAAPPAATPRPNPPAAQARPPIAAAPPRPAAPAAPPRATTAMPPAVAPRPAVAPPPAAPPRGTTAMPAVAPPRPATPPVATPRPMGAPPAATTPRGTTTMPAAAPPRPVTPSAAPPRPTAEAPVAAPSKPAPPPLAARPTAPPPVPPRAPARAPDIAATSVTDLPTPVDRASAQSFKVPTIDLPTPARPSVAPFRAPEPPPFSSSGADDLELSMPIDDDFAANDDNEAAMISVAELDLPAPAGIVDLPAPAGVVDLPQPIGLDLPAPADAGLLTPADTGLLTPADQGVQPAHILPAPADQSLQPTSARRGGAAQASGAAAATATRVEADRAGYDPSAQRRSPAPRAIGPGAGRRPLYLALGGLALVGLCVGGAYAIGMFDPPEDIPVNTGRKPIAKDGKQGDTKAPVAPAATASERDAATLALLARDTPQGYIEAIASAEKAGDRVGQAEAALLMHLRYGPDSARATQAATWLEPYAAQGDPFVRRVLGLVALGSGALEQADGMLVGDDAKTRLYRGWLRLKQSRAKDAVTEADAVIALKPDDTGALVLRHAARAQLDPRGELAAIDASLAKLAGHPGLLVVGVRAATAAGELRRARAWLDAITAVEGTSKGWEGTKLRLRGDLEQAAGALPTAAKLYEEAMAAAPEDRELALARVRVMMAAGRVGDAETAIRKLVEAKPDDIDALLLQAEVFVAAGKGDDAKTLLDSIEKAAPGRARTSYLLGLVHSMRAETELGRTAFAAAVQRDPTLLEATLAEARVLADGDKLAEALAVLDTARKSAADRGSKRDEAAILRAKAAMLAKAGQAAAAAAALDQALEADPLDNAAQLARGLAKLESGDYAGGKTDLLALYERTGPMAGLIAPLGRIFVREGSLTELEALVGGVVDDPDALPEVLIVAARLRLAQAKADDAKALLQRVLDMLPNDWEANLLLAQAMLDSKDYAGALVQVDRSTPAVPSAEKYLLRGRILEFNGKHAEARPEYLRALKIDPSLTEARFLYGRLLAFANESRGAVDELGKVVAEAPDKYAEAWESLGRAQRDLGEQEAAVKSLEKALALDETLFTASYLLGRLRFERNEMAKAVSALEKATDEGNKDKESYADAWVFLARAQAKSGSNKAAVASYKKFLELAPAGHPSRADAEKQVHALR